MIHVLSDHRFFIKLLLYKSAAFSVFHLLESKHSLIFFFLVVI